MTYLHDNISSQANQDNAGWKKKQENLPQNRDIFWISQPLTEARTLIPDYYLTETYNISDAYSQDTLTAFLPLFSYQYLVLNLSKKCPVNLLELIRK